MAEQALTPLEQSIEHWKQNAEASITKDVSVYTRDCALCNLYNRGNMQSDEICKGCPVYAKTGRHLCMGTPYDAASGALDRWRYAEDHREECDLEYYKEEFRAAARMEVDFLTSLLQENDKC